MASNQLFHVALAPGVKGWATTVGHRSYLVWTRETVDLSGSSPVGGVVGRQACGGGGGSSGLYCGSAVSGGRRTVGGEGKADLVEGQCQH